MVVAAAICAAAIGFSGTPTAAAGQTCKISGSSQLDWFFAEQSNDVVFNAHGSTIHGPGVTGTTIPCADGQDIIRAETWTNGVHTTPSPCWDQFVSNACHASEMAGANAYVEAVAVNQETYSAGNWCAESHHVFWNVTGDGESTMATPSYACRTVEGGEQYECEQILGFYWNGSTREYNPPGSPILVPLTVRQDYKLTSAAEGVAFDLNGDGVPEQISWTAADSNLAFLALDRNANGRIDNGTELFGDHTLPGVDNGFKALAQIGPINGPIGWIDADDPIYPKLLLWEDRNHNGVSEPDELQPASGLLARIGLGYSLHNRRDGHGNRFRWRGWAQVRTGPGLNRPTSGADANARQINLYDVLFVSQ